MQLHDGNTQVARILAYTSRKAVYELTFTPTKGYDKVSVGAWNEESVAQLVAAQRPGRAAGSSG